ncbi:hypothetical protein CWI75_11385 [Kineobactrum sediminis]|uniref:Secreted protein n=1 Tax=Kineobactrum sediminis TaxID=1905677 RepID=A0A2N5Y1U6_9GAMM|nr:DUF6746 family protein [Kineobactrum sediminis]PLW82360.1 hypothetical protein CWI75_11385 [Kineobactrum sediminis]
MKFVFIVFPLAVWVLFASQASADDRPGHFRGEPSATLEEAFANLESYNARLRDTLDSGEVQGDDFNQIHLLTYTLENALERIESELEMLEESLEEIHIGSERGEPGRIDENAADYFSRADSLLKAAGGAR